MSASIWNPSSPANNTTADLVAFTPTATIAATDVQNAIDEADTENRALSLEVRTDLASTAAGKGDALVGVKLDATGAVARTQHDKNAEQITDSDFGAAGVSTTTDDTAALQALLTEVQTSYDPAAFGSNSPANGSCTARFKSGYFKLTDALTITKKVAFAGDGPAEFSSGTRLAQFGASKDLILVSPIAQGMSFSVENMTLLSNTSGTGDLIHVTAGLAACNSQRYLNLVLGTPQRLALNIEKGDDIMASRLLFDVSAVSAVALGTGAAGNVVSNASLSDFRFFAVNARCILLYNVIGVQINGVSAYPANDSGRTQYFIDGTNSVPYQIKQVTVNGGLLKNVDCVATVTGCDGLSLLGLSGFGLGLGVSSTNSIIEFFGTCTRVSLKDLVLEGSVGSKYFIDCSGGTVSGSITGCHFKNTGGGAVAAFNGMSAFTGTVKNNTFEGFTTPSLSQRFSTTGSAITPGTIAAGGAYTYTTTVAGAAQGDQVEITPPGTSDPVANNIIVRAWVSAANTVSIKYTNPTAAGIAVAAHDLSICVTRG